MTATLTEMDGGRILYFLYKDPWSLTDLENINSAALKIVEEADKPVHILINCAGIRTTPPGALRARNTKTLTHPKVGQMAIVKLAPFMRELSKIIFKITHFDRARFFETDEAALAFLRGAENEAKLVSSS